MTDADLVTLGSEKGRQNYSCFLPDVVDSVGQPCVWHPASRARPGRGPWEAETSLDLGLYLVSEFSECGEHS